ncbi:Phosphopantetheine adenylyltransferase [bioreactor metagenome]|jgi:pantetheine-phosphate adenylyltransferase|uniref:Phosphopantetheine adenylyltransferase n=1 Tax=bioreactor metagenome TaxID=1076179 RepID=A0A644WAP9_9ZZZZ|nr:pantetheine-phosphate adenylyltransferase [Bacteroidales bacterium]WRQ33187.1 pantetheine-phosphate adenylyltransferase [Bacteroidales bacterium MB20-C3-3]MBP6454563.1 pantetheine-phosphate adenylyltransferase [Bacteroidales bacterium]MBP8677190.1 pantetheine-phosphate adenylyltransferase [Bacteroidales bacterium]MBP9584394.1 pantetheine-phosphate adenylyltransferase [Bacteroidales bacterium]
MMRKAVFPGSFDPFTKGHLDVLQSSLRVFDKVVVAVGYNINKSGLFTIEERIEIIKESVKNLNNVEVESYTGLTINFCNSCGADFIVRGIRSTTDFDFEQVIAQANYKLSPNIQTVFIPSSAECSFITSTVVRDLLLNGGDARIFLAPGVDLTGRLRREEKNEH